MTKIYHPNIDKLGRICLDILKVLDKWSPALQIRTVLLSIQALLSAPNPEVGFFLSRILVSSAYKFSNVVESKDPLATDVAEQWKTNETEAIRTAREWTLQYARE
ncbi:unnamed protein product [Strongylus vulgaris]|uniref:UBC core domain-containing protein n=1 Tax=Strongylus vulgaris TaxID=40348 RepID=A0A3P7KD34_STRVU|nr:unnamed protein product [Strongylus vulgaris]